MAAPIITPIPTTPIRSDAPADFAAKADAFAASLPQFVTETNASAAFVDQRAIDADASAQAAAASEAAAEADRAEVATNAATVATNTATVVARADEVAANTLQVAADADQVAADRVAVDAALASIADGPVTSVAGQTGVVTLEQLRAGGVATQAGEETLSNKTIDGGIYNGPVVALAANTLDCALGNYFTRTISANSTFAFSNVPASRAYSCTLELTHTGGTVTWPASVRWPGDTAPSLTTGKTHLFMFVTDDGGARWRGACLADYTN